ncbi:transmembrane protein 109-like isoform X1 [Megalops cyprinoides]|uniref:transmembrane protein 109-like isoform X1 n=1 Tax=Megalops cyprinoides TaxID=118141 RepID=UPI0018654835|nr:transmembrane protein 109-like isoform X1 [Megalops cyprinoides]
MYSHRVIIHPPVTLKTSGFAALVLVLLSVLVPGCVEGAVPLEEPQKSEGMLVGLRPLLTEWSEETHRYMVSVLGTHAIETAAENAKLYLDSVFGQEMVEAVSECVRMAIRFLSVGAASGLNVIAVYVTEILRAAGITVTLPFPHFTPEGVASVAQWALLALIGYWVLSLVLRLAVSLLRRVLWLLKLCAGLWLFALIVGDTRASTDTTALRLACLVLAWALLGLVRTDAKGDETKRLGAQVRHLEGRLREMEERKMEE